MQKGPTASFSTVISAKERSSPQIFLKFSFNPLDVKFQGDT